MWGALGRITPLDPFLDLVWTSSRCRMVWEPVTMAGLLVVGSLGETVFWKRSVEKAFLTSCWEFFLEQTLRSETSSARFCYTISASLDDITGVRESLGF